jgi:hypothetical protein
MGKFLAIPVKIATIVSTVMRVEGCAECANRRSYRMIAPKLV